MFFHENEKCPVCDRFFTADDDIVVCPECATPHHRECYKQLGHCANNDRHDGEFVYKSDESAVEPAQTDCRTGGDNAENSADSENSYFSQQDGNRAFCKSCGREINKSDPFCYNCGVKQDFPEYEQATAFVDASYNDDGERIDGRRVKDIADTVRTNTSRFIEKFRKNKLVSWNWGAFFFGPYYLFFRKMYKEGVIAVAINLITNLIVNGFYVEQITAFSNLMTMDFVSKFLEKPTPEMYNQIMHVSEPLIPAMIILYSVSLLINIIITLTADKIYRAKVMSIIDKVYSDNQDSSLMQSSMFQAEMNMSKSQLRTFYLSRKGGTSLFSPLLAYMVLNLIMSFISRI